MPPREGRELGCRRIPVARANGMALWRSHPVLTTRNSVAECCRARRSVPVVSSLEAFFPTALPFGEVLHFLLVDFDLARLLHLLAEVRQEHSEEVLLLGAQQAVANLIFLGCEVLLGRILLLQNRQDHAIVPGIDGPAD